MDDTSLLSPEPSTDDQVEAREKLLSNAMKFLETEAYRLIHECNHRPDQFVMVCIKPHEAWLNILKRLAPHIDWEEAVEDGTPILRGSATFSLCEALGAAMPPLKESFMSLPPEGYVKTIVLDDSGGTVYEIIPRPAVRH